MHSASERRRRRDEKPHIFICDSALRGNFINDRGRRNRVALQNTHDDFGPAYAYGVDAFARYPDRDFDDFEAELHRDWGEQRKGSSLDWARAKPAVKDAWQRIKEASNMPPSTR